MGTPQNQRFGASRPPLVLSEGTGDLRGNTAITVWLLPFLRVCLPVPTLGVCPPRFIQSYFPATCLGALPLKNSVPLDVTPISALAKRLWAYVAGSWRRWMRSGWRGVQAIALLLVVAAGVFYWVKRNAPQVNPALFDYARTYTLLTGQTSKEYHRVGGMLANAINERAAELGIRLVIRPSRGTSHNMDAVIAGEADLGFVQAQQYYPGPGIDQEPEFLHRETKVLAQLYTSSATLLVAPHTQVRRLEDLKGKRVGVLSFSTSDRSALIDLLTAASVPYWIPPDERKGGVGVEGGETPGLEDVVIQLNSLNKLGRRLKQQELDAFFLTSVHPSPLVRRYLIGNGLRFAAIISNIEALRLRSNAYYETTISVDAYGLSSTAEDIPTVGTRMLLVASGALPDEVAYGITKALYEAVEKLKSNPFAQDMSGPSMVDGVALENLHPGALQFYQERRLLTRAHRPPPPRASELPRLMIPKSSAVTELLHGLHDPMTEKGEPLVTVVEATQADLAEAPINRLITGRYSLGLLNEMDARGEPLTRSQSLERLSTRSIRSVCRVPGDVAQLIIAEERQATSLLDVSGMVIGVAQDDPRATRILDWMDHQLLSMHAAPVVRSLRPSSLLVSVYLRREVDGLLVLDAAPSTLLTEIIQAPLEDPQRPFRLIGLEQKGSSDGALEGFVPTLLPPNLYPEIANESTSTWLEPLTLLASARLSPITVQQLVLKLIPLVRARPTGRSWDAHALLSSLSFPLHEGVALAREALLAPLDETSATPVSEVSLTPPGIGQETPGVEGVLANSPGPVGEQLPSPSPTHMPPNAADSGPKSTAKLGARPDALRVLPNIPLEPALDAPLILTASNPVSPVFETASAISEVMASFCRPNLEGKTPCRRGAQLSLLGTRDSEESLRALLEDKAQYALVHADLLHAALNKQPPWDTYSTGKIRSIATLYVAALTVLASKKETLGGHVTGGGALKPGEQRMVPKDVSNISSLSDLEGRRVSIRHTVEPLARNNAITLFNRETFLDSLWKLSLVPEEPPPLDSGRLFLDGTILALFFMSPHPVTWVESLLKRNRESLLLPVTGLERYLETNPHLSRALIDVSVYDDEQRGRKLIPTIGIPVILVTTTSAPDWQVEMLLSTLLAEAKLLGSRYPILNHLALDFMQNCANIEPHRAAESFYQTAVSFEPKR